MARGFMRGLLFGGVIGAVVAAFTRPQLKPMKKMRGIMGRSRKVSKGMSKLYKNVRGGINDIID